LILFFHPFDYLALFEPNVVLEPPAESHFHKVIKRQGRKDEGLSVRAAHARTGIAAADFSRVRNADLGRFTVDRLMSIMNRLGSRVEVKIKVRRVGTGGHRAIA